MVDLSNQSQTVIAQLVERHNMQINVAADTWYSSQTKKILEERGLDYVSGMRCYWELQLELSNDPRWMKEPFDM